MFQQENIIYIILLYKHILVNLKAWCTIYYMPKISYPFFIKWVYYENWTGHFGHSVCQTKLAKYTNSKPELKNLGFDLCCVQTASTKWLNLSASKILTCWRKFNFLFKRHPRVWSWILILFAIEMDLFRPSFFSAWKLDTSMLEMRG